MPLMLRPAGRPPVVLDRTRTADFYKKFPPGHKYDPAEVQSYAQRNAITNITPVLGSLKHKPYLRAGGDRYHPGHVLTEQEAFNHGYVEPHIDTIVCKIVEETTTAGRDETELTRALHEKGLIPSTHSIAYTPGRIHVFRHDILESLRNLHEHNVLDHQSHDANHPVEIMVFPRNKTKIPIGVLAYYVSSVANIEKPINTVFEFMTALNLEEPANATPFATSCEHH